MTDKISQVRYYEETGHASGNEDRSDFSIHLERRTSLYKDLGLPPFAFAGKDVLDVGCGSGYTSVHLALLKPRRLVLLEPARSCHQAIADNFRRHAPNAGYVLETLFAQDAGPSDDLFDIVVAEGFVPSLRDAPLTAQNIGRRVRPGGCLCLTTQDAAGYLADLVKRFIGRWLVRGTRDFEERKAILFPFFGDLLNVPGMSRSTDAWVLDNVLQPLYNWDFFSTEEAIGALGEDFVFYSCSSPRFTTEGRWYKHQCGEGNDFNSPAVAQYRRNLHNMLDHRHVLPERAEEEGLALLSVCRGIAAAMASFEERPDPARAGEVVEGLGALADLGSAGSLHPETVGAIAEARAFLDLLVRTGERGPARQFPSWAGRGQHYVSLLKRDGAYLR
jgi:SAM-dependent methyltransferase